MASLAAIKVFGRNRKTDEQLAITCACSVSKYGDFSVVFPDYLVPSMRALVAKGERGFQDCSIGKGPKNWIAGGKNLDRLKALLQAAADDYLSATISDEVVILYGTDSRVAYAIDKDGSLQPNGSLCKGDWNKGEARWAKSELSASRGAEFYSIAAVAVIAKKSSCSRPTGTVVKYSRVMHRDADELGEWAAKLGGFTGIGIDLEHYRLEEMPYTEEAARFFTLLLLGLCELDRRLQSFMGDRTKLLQVIAEGGPLQLTGPAP